MSSNHFPAIFLLLFIFGMHKCTCNMYMISVHFSRIDSLTSFRCCVFANSKNERSVQFKLIFDFSSGFSFRFSQKCHLIFHSWIKIAILRYASQSSFLSDNSIQHHLDNRMLCNAENVDGMFVFFNGDREKENAHKQWLSANDEF